MQFDRDKFFSQFRPWYHKWAEKKLPQSAVDGVEFLLSGFENLADPWTLPQIVYALATVFHETAFTFQPVTEYGGRKYFDKYDTGKLAKSLGNTPEADGDGFLFRGRGYCQITGRANYERMGGIIGADLITVPDRALQPHFAFKILVVGMEKGLFTGLKITDFINANRKDYQNARRVINGTDKAKLIAAYALELEGILKAAKVEPPCVEPDLASILEANANV